MVKTKIMNNRAYNKAKEHLRDFTKFPTINDIVLLMEEHAKDVSIEFTEWKELKGWVRSARRDELSWVNEFIENGITKYEFQSTKELYTQFLKEQENEKLYD